MKVKVENPTELIRIIDKALVTLKDQISDNNLVQEELIDREWERRRKTLWGKLCLKKRKHVVELLYSDMGHPWWDTFYCDMRLRENEDALAALKSRVLTARELFGQDVPIELDSDEMTLLSQVQE